MIYACICSLKNISDDGCNSDNFTFVLAFVLVFRS